MERCAFGVFADAYLWVANKVGCVLDIEASDDDGYRSCKKVKLSLYS